jgi:hypothetical protein
MSAYQHCITINASIPSAMFTNPYVVDGLSPTLTIVLDHKHHSRSLIREYISKFEGLRVEVAHEPFIEVNSPVVLEQIDAQRLVVEGEPYIDDFGFYVYVKCELSNEPKFIDHRYDD